MPNNDFAARGPHPVGVQTLEILSPNDPLTKPGDAPRRLPCEIWYPASTLESSSADCGANATLQTEASHPLGLPHRAHLDLPPLETPGPLIGFSHGNSGLRQQSTFLMTHLASWGFVVIAPDHVGNTFSEMLALDSEDARREAHLRARAQRPHDLAAALSRMTDPASGESKLLTVDPCAIGVMGHSYGGWTALKLAGLERRVRSICCLAPASEPFVGRRAFEAGELPLRSDVEALVIAGEDDVLVDLETSIRPLHARLGDRAQLEVLRGADHFHFCDGIELLHKMHENTPRPNQPRATRPLAELRSEGETHEWLNERVTRFFRASLAIRQPNGNEGAAH